MVTQDKILIRGELALIFAVFIDAFGVVLMLYSGAGISAISSLPFAFSEVLPVLTLGTWTYLFQGLLIFSLMIMRKRFVLPYLFSFVVGFIFGELLDFHELWIDILPTALHWRIIYFILSYLIICVGIALSNRCQMPIVPTDLFPRELEDITKIGYPKIKIGFDATLFAGHGRDDGVFLGTSGRSRHRHSCRSPDNGKRCRHRWRLDGSSFSICNASNAASQWLSITKSPCIGAFCYVSGSVRMVLAPLGTFCVNRTSPPCASMICSTM